MARRSGRLRQAPASRLILPESRCDDGLREVDGPNYTAEQARLTYLSGAHQGAHLYPERRFYEAERSQTTEAAITTDLTGHLYAVVGEVSGDKRVLRICITPMLLFGSARC